mgnify:CR=1 FL=1
MKKRRYLRAYTGMILASGLISFVLTDGFIDSRGNIILFDPKALFFVILFTLIYSFMVDQGRSISTQSIGRGALYGGVLGYLIGVTLTLDLPAKEQSLGWNHAILPLCCGVLVKFFADAFTKAEEPVNQMKRF